MDQDGTWGRDLELLCFAHLCKTCVFSHSKKLSNWDRYGPHNVDRNIVVHVSEIHPSCHYDVVGSTVKVPSESKVPHKGSDSSTSGEDGVRVSCNVKVWHDMRFHCGGVEWQLEMCTLLHLQYNCSNTMEVGGPNVLLTRPKLIKLISGDGNCLFG